MSDRKKGRIPGFRQPRQVAYPSIDAAIFHAIRTSFEQAPLRDAISRANGVPEEELTGGAFVFLRRYELEALADLLDAGRDTPKHLIGLREQLLTANVFEPRIGGQG